jgi:hypothetical protein
MSFNPTSLAVIDRRVQGLTNGSTAAGAAYPIASVPGSIWLPLASLMASSDGDLVEYCSGLPIDPKLVKTYPWWTDEFSSSSPD